MQEELRGIQDRRTLTEMPGRQWSSLRGDTKGSTFSDRPGNRRPRPPPATLQVWSLVIRRLGGRSPPASSAMCGWRPSPRPRAPGCKRLAQQWLILSPDRIGVHARDQHVFAELPLLLFTLIGGVIADRHDRRHLLMGSQAVQMACALTLTAIVFFDVTRVRYILALSFISGLAQAFGGPAFQSLLPSLVPRQHLTERGSAEIDPVQPRPDNRPGQRRGGAGHPRHGGLLRLNGLSFPCCDRRARADASTSIGAGHPDGF